MGVEGGINIHILRYKLLRKQMGLHGPSIPLVEGELCSFPRRRKFYDVRPRQSIT